MVKNDHTITSENKGGDRAIETFSGKKLKFASHRFNFFVYFGRLHR